MAKSRTLFKTDEYYINDFDPENDDQTSEEEDTRSEDSSHDLTGIEHYAQVNKSKIRRPTEVSFGPKYSGSVISRQALHLKEGSKARHIYNEDPDATKSEDFTNDNKSPPNIVNGDGSIVCDIVSNETDIQVSTDYSSEVSEEPRKIARGQNKSHKISSVLNNHIKQNEEKLLKKNHSRRDDTQNYSSSDTQELSSLVNFSDSNDNYIVTDENGNDNHEKATRSELQKIMKEDHETVMSKISQAAKADVEKGKAIRAQRLIFDSLLNVRISLQKALISINSTAVAECKNFDQFKNEPYDAAEHAAITLWNKLDDFRHKMIKANSSNPIILKKKSEIDLTTPSSIIWESMQHLDAASSDHRKITLEKWSFKVRDSVTLPISENFKPATQTSLTSVTLDQLANSEQLVRRTKIPRSCAPIQRELKILQDPNIYDDGDFYRTLLKEILEQRKIGSLNVSVSGNGDNKSIDWDAVKETKTRKVIDTRASKGRKMRFIVHEKLQNFAAPQDRGSWEPMAIDRLFGSLLGQKVFLDESENANQENYLEPEDESLRLFRS